MKEITFRNSRIALAGGENSVASITVENGVISAIEFGVEGMTDSGEWIFENLRVMPGFVDIHNHGAVGVDVNEADADGLMKIAGFLAKNGVTAWLPTLVPDADENYERAIDAIDELMELQVGKPVAQAVGVHYEGVFANEAMCGALRPEYFKSGRRSKKNHPVGEAPPPLLRKEGSLIDLPRLKKGVHMTTLAPEIDGGIELIEEFVADGWVVSIGHTCADVETLDRAYEVGARHMTHFFNAMTGVHHRELGVAGWGLANKGVTFDIITDGFHVHPSMVELACRAKTPDKVTLISDSASPAGLGDGEFELWGGPVTVEGGRTRNTSGGLASSVCTMLDCVKTMRLLDISDVEVAKMASANPAKLLGHDDRGTIEVGKRADLVGLHANGNLAFTMIGGKIVRPL
jgi:N-acetylglucosamine-6-phosphate deacetylase